MAERKWGAITSGATFEALATTVVFFEDPKASLFGRRGKDGGQDARSGDDLCVFQAKHHENGSAASAIRDAKEEAKKIKMYRQPGHSRYDQWKGVTHWRLVTNAAFNPTNKQAWDSEVVPLFAKQGLVADYWERENLNALLDKHPEIHRSFFENETRAFLSIPEIKERLPHQEPFLRRDELGPFCGREAEIAKIRNFLTSQQLFLVVHGAGGMGKTRLLAEAGETIASEGKWQVLWANVASMAASGAWFEAIVPERSTLLLVDEPADEFLLQQLSEQLGGRLGRAARWKVAVAVRSQKDPVLRFLRSARMKARVQELPIAALRPADAEAMCAELLMSGQFGKLSDEVRRDAARELSKRFSRHPVWLTLAVQHLEDHGNLKELPATATELAEEYLREVERSQFDVSPDSVRNILRWVALIGTVNREDDATIKMIAEGSGIGSVLDVQQRLASLLGRRVLIERGAHNRFVELKPDVLRDHVLRRWLSAEIGGEHPVVASDEAKALLEVVRNATVSGSLSGLGHAILVSLARTEFLLRLSGYDLQLLAGLFTAIEASIPSMTTNQRLNIADILETVAPFQPRAAASLVKAMRRSHANDETVEGIFSKKVIGQNDVILSLAWPLLHGAMGAESVDDREFILRELCALTEAEAELEHTLPRGLPNDGKRAAALVTRVLEGGPQFWGEYDEAAKTLGLELLDTLTKHPPTRGQSALLKALIQPVLALERRQTWSDEQAVHIQTFEIGPGHAAWAIRNSLFDRLKTTLSADETPLESRVQLWHVFAEAHRNISQLRRTGKSDHYYALLLDDLTWSLRLLANRQAPLKELFSAREIWSWHYRFETDPKLKETSIQLERLYEANDLAQEFEHLLSSADWDRKDLHSAQKAKTLASAIRPDEITRFVERAVSFLGDEHKLYRLMGIAWSLGEHAESRDVVRTFVKTCLHQLAVSPQSDFGVTTAVSWVATVRKGPHPERTHVLVNELLDECGSDDQRANLLQRIYGRVPKLRDVGEFTAAEHALLRGARLLFTTTGRDVAFIAAIALTLEHDWQRLKPLLEDVLRSVPSERLRQAIRALVDSIYWAVRDDDPSTRPSGLAEWLMDQLIALPNFNDLSGDGEWHLTEIIKRVGYVRVNWLPEALVRRRDQEASQPDDHTARAIGYHARLSKYVRRVTAADVENTEVKKAVNDLLTFVNDNGSVGYYLPKILRDIDPDGLLVPSAVVAQIKASDPEFARRLARIASAYAVNSAPWRTIAAATIHASMPLGEEALHPIYNALSEREHRSWSAPLGEVPPIFAAALEQARSALNSEADHNLRPYWQYRISIAEAELREQEEYAKERGGE
ncbi:ATP-binding protein [Myxococcus sp. AB036A]|uniref:ATP-binding protein n=1 Tax=Myxococcus sp. AB036A TaxID=2562793 RepID=UPI001146EB8E|nr:ATP-binding protein [Myxococcus sp. AB036A]